jgi:hypothetical protein
MSHVGRIVALIMVAIIGCLVAFGGIGAVSASAPKSSTVVAIEPPIKCC